MENKKLINDVSDLEECFDENGKYDKNCNRQAVKNYKEKKRLDSEANRIGASAKKARKHLRNLNKINFELTF